ncbi:MAG TPA: cupin domain-containing protein [Actinomycetales bacterium]|nr:cupin domain-containing protein [Actinomycetales bacterium]
MSAPAPARVPGQTSGHPALRRLVADDIADFADRTWGRAPLLSPAERLPQGFGDLLSAQAVDELVSERGLRTPFLRVAKNGTTLAERSFTAPGGVGAAIGDQVSDDKLVQLFGGGATMVLQGLHRIWPPLVRFTQQLAADLGHPVQANAYVTPPQSQGFDDHYDVHDVFVLQVEGEKRWRIRPPVHPAPLRDQPWTDRRPEVEGAARKEPLIDVVLRPSDCLYLPRGYLHAATALGGVSTHLTIGVHTWTRYALAEELAAVALARLADDVAVRESLQLGTVADDAAGWANDLDRVRAALERAVRDVAAERVADRMSVRARAAQRAAPVGPLAQLRAATAPDPSGTVRLRDHLAARLVDGPQGPVLRSRAGSLSLQPGDDSMVARLLAGERLSVADVGEDLAHRLLLAAVVVPD